jgi:soluble lytic murein transglycosylase-like protein
MPTNLFGNDFFDSVLGTAKDNLGSWMQALPSFPDFSTPPPSFGGDTGYAGVPGASQLGTAPLSNVPSMFDMGINLFDNSAQMAINAARARGPQTAAQLVGGEGTYPGGQAPAGQAAPTNPTMNTGGKLPVAPSGELVDYARKVAAQYGIDPEVFVRQINQESGFNPNAHSKAGAMGIAQFMPGTAASYGVNTADPYSSLDGAARLMKHLMDKYHGNARFALAAYNAGEGNVDKYGEGVFSPSFANGQTAQYIHAILGG